jgi:hypothetical protein
MIGALLIFAIIAAVIGRICWVRAEAFREKRRRWFLHGGNFQFEDDADRYFQDKRWSNRGQD